MQRYLLQLCWGTYSDYVRGTCRNVNSYECVEICNRAARHGSVVKLLVRDFITMKLKDVDVVVGDACPAR
eukprot:3737641-Rhodomonas_salina.1